jgi:hypothetical protein
MWGVGLLHGGPADDDAGGGAWSGGRAGAALGGDAGDDCQEQLRTGAHLPGLARHLGLHPPPRPRSRRSSGRLPRGALLNQKNKTLQKTQVVKP